MPQEETLNYQADENQETNKTNNSKEDPSAPPLPDDTPEDTDDDDIIHKYMLTEDDPELMTEGEADKADESEDATDTDDDPENFPGPPPLLDTISDESDIPEEAEDEGPLLMPDEDDPYGDEGYEDEVPYMTADDSPLAMRMEELQKQLEGLEREFQSKIKYDAHKNKIIDDLHQELQTYKNDIIRKHLQSFIMDIIQFADNTRKLTRYYHEDEDAQKDPEKLLSILDEIPSDIEAIIGREGVMPFISENGRFDPSRQRAMKRTETSDPEKDKHIAESLQPGYEWDDRIIRPEIVSVYVYKKEADKE